jgi:myo-inositol-1(or 4)-monophosphatase
VSRSLVQVAESAARAGGRVIAEAARERDFRVSTKSPSDFVTEVDFASETEVVRVLAVERPDDAILGEEGVADTAGAESARHRWVIDPLDGTTNFIRDLPAYAVSVSCEERGRPVAAAVLDVPRGELYRAARGQGAEVVLADGEVKSLSVSPAERFEDGLWLTGIPFRNLEPMEKFLVGLEHPASGSCGIRRFGSAALDLCFVARGRAEGFWEYGLSRWDVSAGALLVEEAGGRVSDFAGGEAHLDSGDICASNGALHQVLLDKAAGRG